MGRYFEVVSKYKDKEINLPKRSTAHSVGYDFECAEATVIPSIWKHFLDKLCGREEAQKEHVGTYVPTGIKASFETDEKLNLYARSSIFNKLRLILANGVGVVECDYYNNPDNEGHIMFNYINFGFHSVTIPKGYAVGQGVFSKFLVTDDDSATGARIGGFGSTDGK